MESDSKIQTVMEEILYYIIVRTFYWILAMDHNSDMKVDSNFLIHGIQKKSSDNNGKGLKMSEVCTDIHYCLNFSIGFHLWNIPDINYYVVCLRSTT